MERPENAVWGQGRGRPAWEPLGRRATLPSLLVALGMARPAIPGDRAEKLRAGWELGRVREGTPFDDTLGKRHSVVMETLSVLTGTLSRRLSPWGPSNQAGTSKERFRTQLRLVWKGLCGTPWEPGVQQPSA